jgi:hypothetical protein
VVAGLCRAARLEGLIDSDFSDTDVAGLLNRRELSGLLAGMHVLILGLGKVGLPLAGFLDGLGAEVYGFDPGLSSHGPDDFYFSVRAKGGAVDESHLRLVQAMVNGGRVFRDEAEALTDPRIQVISPNGGHTSYFASSIGGKPGPTRAELISAASKAGSGAALILGAGNDQIPGTADRKTQRDAALAAFDDAGVRFVPDPIVSPGGVIAVSHELAEEWRADSVIADACALVGASTSRLYAAADEQGGRGAKTMYSAFEKLHGVSAD